MVSKSKFRIPRSIGFGAGLLALILVVYSAVGAVWGMWRPTLTGREVEDGGYAIENVADVQFSSFIVFAVLVGFLGLCFGLFSYMRGATFRGVGQLLWCGVACLAGAAAFYVVGGVTAHSAPADPGQVVQFVPKFDPGIAWVVSPFMAMFAYWSAAFVDVPGVD
ncbi:hypothetical protein HMPREF3153_09385 [Corynebacterium sp. HMSC06C06]|uniref:hypothetical protein n=1 Tax=Corynebacterium striatum TaxID=43770 RepID=UPI00069B3E9B|nr:hypothetical protein [Corynebacterium striatum]OFT50679.1 hypothetical protein HMPREF3153_09385 [Corynebacterium sp. HMSC06C06]MBD0854192.1 hypothetical protein [Corynebacterium striatum]MDK7883506.1 hypothetical protein [Corynebacterium striatum]MDK8812145.1 hypothetical protein [Corynebacterium striatum]PXY12937.1 hypothetical protein CKF74_08145 [Corynebacterium striatum]